MRDPARTISQYTHSKFKSIGSSTKQVSVKKFLKYDKENSQNIYYCNQNWNQNWKHLMEYYCYERTYIVMIGVVCIMNAIMGIMNIVHPMTVIWQWIYNTDLNIILSTDKTNINIQQYEMYCRYFDVHVWIVLNVKRIKSNAKKQYNNKHYEYNIWDQSHNI
eukprot:187132_1